MPALRRYRLSKGYRRKRIPSDLFIEYNGYPVCIRELEMWMPGLTTKMGIVEAIQWIPVFLGVSKEPVSLLDTPVTPTFESKRTREAKPFGIEHHTAQKELVNLRLKYRKIPEENIEEREALLKLIEDKHNEVIDLYKKYSMVSKLSENSDKN